MQLNARKRERADAKKENQYSSPERKAFVFYLAIIAIALSILANTAAHGIWDTYFSQMHAITTPVGIWYLQEPYDWLVDHEECHLQRIQEIGAVAFYSNYLLGGACLEELRCGETLQHPACTSYPFSQLPANVSS